VSPPGPAPASRTLALALPAARGLALATLLGAGAIAASIGLTGTSAWLISRAAQQPNEATLALAIVAVQIFGLSRGFFRYGERLVGHEAAFRLLAELRVRVFERLAALAPAGASAFRRADLLSRLTRDVDSLQELLLRVVPPFAVAVLVGVATVIVVGVMLPAAAIVLALALVIAATAVPGLTGRLARRHEGTLAAARGHLAEAMVDLVEGSDELSVHGGVADQLARVTAADAELKRVARAAAGTAGIGLALTTLLTGLAMWGDTTVGVAAVHSGRLDGTLLAVIALIPLAAFEIVATLPAATQSWQRARQTAGRVFEVIDAPDPVPETLPTGPLPERPRPIVGRGVGGRYPAQREAALAGVDMALTPGCRLAVVGPSGAGKTTLAALLVRFLPYEGSLTLGGTELGALAAPEVRTVVGLVTQDPHLFDTTLAANLRIGCPNAPDEEVYSALGRVGLGPWLESLPEGLDTELGSRGARLSGGQRQRVCVARALLARFDVLVVDEPTEHLDRVGADAMVADLVALDPKRSVVLVTHRLAGLEAMDEILVLDHGSVVERGTHEDLLGSGGPYRRLWGREVAAAGDRGVSDQGRYSSHPGEDAAPSLS
jgi:ATP-binding cassette, subfamily C, bacterial CydCD